MARKALTLFIILISMIAFVQPSAAQSQSSTITLLHFSDYHSHALPFYAEGEANTAGIARAIAYLKPYAADPNALIFSGGDTINLGAPVWSDKYRCVEWPWFNGIVDAMAFGNHDADYGPEVFAECQAQIDYPILGANILDADGQPLFLVDGKTYKVFEINGLRIGVFAVAGDDFDSLVKEAQRPVAGATFGDKLSTAREIVTTLREQEQVNAVVLIGHSLYEEDIALAQAVPGIDLIFGTHSHRKENFMQIPGTNTYFISPFQYLGYISKVELSFSDGRLVGAQGELVRMSNNLPEDPEIVQRVAQLQAELEADPQYAELFQSIGSSAVELSTEGSFTGESVLGNFIMDIARDATAAHLALATSSTFRASIAPGEILEADLRTALPYSNELLVFEMQGVVLQELLDYSVSRSSSDFFSQVSGVRFETDNGNAKAIQVLNDPNNPSAGYSALDPQAVYRVATIDFQGLVAGGYKEIFAKANGYSKTGIMLRDMLRDYIAAHSPVSASLDGRISPARAEAINQPELDPVQVPVEPTAPIPSQLPNTSSGASLPLAWLMPLGLFLLVLGFGLARSHKR